MGMRWWNRPIVPLAGSRPGAWMYVNVLPHVDRVLLRLTRGRLGTVVGEQLALLTTTGAMTGKTRTTPLLVIVEGDDIVAIASKGGNTKHPDWYYNLKANPKVKIMLHGKTTNRVAREAEGDERVELFRKAEEYYPGYTKYQTRTKGRVIPVMVLSPDSEE